MWVKKSALQSEGPIRDLVAQQRYTCPGRAHDYRAGVSSKVILILRQANNWWEHMLNEQAPSIEKWQGSRSQI